MMIGDLFKYWTYQVFSPGTVLREKYEAFKSLLEQDQLAHEGMAELQRICHEALPVDSCRIMDRYDAFSQAVGNIVAHLIQMCPGRYPDLKDFHAKFDQYVRYLLASPHQGHDASLPYTLALSRWTAFEPDQVGGKADALLQIKRRREMPVPHGFVITTNAYRYLIEFNRMQDSVDKALARIHPDEPTSIPSASEELMALIMQADFPPYLKAAIDTALEQLIREHGDNLQLAVRSSAVGEDSDITFAGQYRSCLKVQPHELLHACRQVMASKFSPAALYYRIRTGFEDTKTPMAVMVMEMIEPQWSGVLYSRGPTPDKADMTSIHYVDGHGESLVSGQRRARVISIPHGRKAAAMESFTDALQTPEAPPPSPGPKHIDTLARWAVKLEAIFNTPCDIEWCLDHAGRLYLLQCRPLQQQKPQPRPSVSTAGPSATSPGRVLFQGGSCACAGMGGGPVHRITHDSDLASLPINSVALLTTAPPHYVTLLDRVSAVVVEQGSVAGHFSAVAREFNIPTLVGAKNAGAALKQGTPVTVDAAARIIFAGAAEQSKNRGQGPKIQDIQNPTLRKLTAAMSFIAPLELIDPQAPAFVPQSCRSMHDIIRFAHEKAVYEMFAIGDRRLKRKKGARQLVGDLPLVIYVMDVGGGVREAKAHRQTINIAHVRCEPLQALWRGLTHPDIDWAGHHHFDWAEYDRLVMNGGIISPDSPQLSSYAVVADGYLNFCLKFGYHFAIIDALLQQPAKASHIGFRFTGGGGEPEGIALRVRFIKQILTALDFNVKSEGELINARQASEDRTLIADRLVRIGHLLGVTRLMDMHLKDEATVDRLAEVFLKEEFTHFNWETQGSQTP